FPRHSRGSPPRPWRPEPPCRIPSFRARARISFTRPERRTMANPEDITVDDKANQWDRIVTADDATEIANKAIIARYVYATNIMDLDSFDGYVAEDYVEEEPIPG